MMTMSDLPYGNAPKFDQGLIDQVNQAIAEHGVQLVAVYETGNTEYRPFIYTIGLRQRGQPELIAFGEDETELDALAAILYRVARHSDPIDPCAPLPGSGGELVLAAPDSDFDAFIQTYCLIEARDFYGCDRIEVLVVVRESELPEPQDTLH